jgi:hypothetical protein
MIGSEPVNKQTPVPLSIGLPNDLNEAQRQLTIAKKHSGYSLSPRFFCCAILFRWRAINKLLFYEADNFVCLFKEL